MGATHRHHNRGPRPQNARADILVGYDVDDDPVTIPHAAFRQHSLVFGGSGFGKSYLCYLLALEQLKAGASLVVLDPKREGVRRMRHACEAADLTPDRVQTIDAAEVQAVPGFNPFRTPGSAEEVAAAFMSLFDRAGLNTGPRMRQFAENAVKLAVWHDLRVTQVTRILLDEKFRMSLLASRPVHPVDDAYVLVEEYFRERYPVYGKGEAEQSTMALEVAMSQFMGSRLFLRMFNAPENSLDFDALFESQRALLVNFGSGSGLTEQSGLFLASMVVQYLMAAAERRPGDTPVVLMADEFRKLSGFMAEGLRDVANMSRERNIRLLVAAQHPDQIPEGMRADLQTSSVIKAFFNPGQDESESAPKFLARMAPNPTAPEEEEAPEDGEDEDEDYSDVKPYKGQVYCEDFRYPSSGLLALEAQKQPECAVVYVDPGDPNASIRSFVEQACPHALPPLYLKDMRRVRDVAYDLPYGCVSLFWNKGVAYCDVQVPRPRRKKPAAAPAKKSPVVSPKEFWAGTLAQLDPGQAVLSVTGHTLTLVEVLPLKPASDASLPYIAESCDAQSPYPGDTDFAAYLRGLLKPPAPEEAAPAAIAVPKEIKRDAHDESIE